MEKFNVHYGMLPDLIKKYDKKVQIPIKSITNICTIHDTINSMHIVKE